MHERVNKYLHFLVGCKWEGPVERIQEDSMEEDRKQERTQHQVGYSLLLLNQDNQ